MIAWIQQTAAAWSEMAVWIIVQNTIFLALVLGILHLLKNRSANLKYWIGMAALIKCLLPPFLPAPFLRESASAAVSMGQIQPVQVVSMATEKPVFLFSLTESLFLGWILLAVIILFIPATHTLFLKYRLRKAKSISNSDFSYPVPIHITNQIVVPMTLGLFRPKIYVPGQWQTWSPECRAMILRHEHAHIQRMDSWIKIIQTLVQALYAFHPLIWILNRKLDEYREMACDDISVGPERSLSVEYARALVQIAEHLKHSQLGYASASALIRQRNELLNRVQYQMKEPMKRLSRWKTALIILGIACMILPLSWTRAKLEASPPVPSKDESKQTGKIYGTVKDAKTGNPLAGANIFIVGTHMGAPADMNGKFFIQDVPPGVYQVIVSQIGYRALIKDEVMVRLNASTNLNFELDQTVIAAPTLAANSSQNTKPSTIKSPPPPPNANGEKFVFVPYDKPPKPTDGFVAIQKKLVYPELAQKAGIEGRVIVWTLIGADGTVKKTKVSQSIGNGDSGCEEAAINAIKAVQWEPAIQRDLPVEVWIAVPLDFRLSPEKTVSIIVLANDQISIDGNIISIQNFTQKVQKMDLNSGIGIFLGSAPGAKKETIEKVSKILHDRNLWVATNFSEQPTDNIAQFVPYDDPPQPIGGLVAIQEKLVYPELARKAGIEGKVIVQTQIGADGTVKKTTVIQSLGPNGCDEAAMKAIRSVQWTPAKQRNRPIEVWIAVPIDFKIKQ